MWRVSPETLKLAFLIAATGDGRCVAYALPPTFVCAWLSRNLVEQPILSRKTSILAGLDRALEAATAPSA
jgi:hypothetical protein